MLCRSVVISLAMHKRLRRGVTVDVMCTRWKVSRYGCEGRDASGQILTDLQIGINYSSVRSPSLLISTLILPRDSHLRQPGELVIPKDYAFLL